MTFQSRVAPWMTACFGPAISADLSERNHRFLEEAIELVQALGAKRGDAHTLVEYVFNRPSGEAAQEVGGVMVTLAALCLANDLDMHAAGEIELSRVWAKMVQIRAKQAAKPKGSPLPASDGEDHVDRNDVLQRLEDQIAGWPHLRRPGEIVEVRADLLTSAYQEIERLREPKGSAPPADATDAARYRFLRSRDLDTIDKGGVFAGVTPKNMVLNGGDLDQAVDAAMGTPAPEIDPDVKVLCDAINKFLDGRMGYFTDSRAVDDDLVELAAVVGSVQC